MQSTITVIILVLVIAGAAAYVYTTHQPAPPTTTTTQQTHETTTPTGTTTHTTSHPETATTTTGETETETGVSMESDIWDHTEILEAPVLTHDPTEEELYWAPVLINNTFYDFTHVKMMYNYTIGGESIVFNVTWTMTRQPYTASCYNYVQGTHEQKTVQDTITIEYRYTFQDGYWITIRTHLVNETMLPYYNKIPYIDFEAYATPHGIQKSILGADIASSDPQSTGSWSSPQASYDIDHAVQCEPVVQGSPEAYSLMDKLAPIQDHDIILLYQPLEIEWPGGFFDEIGETIKNPASASGGLYDYYYLKTTINGTIVYPGTNFNATLYKLEYWTEPDYVHGYCLITPFSILPVYYQAIFPQGDKGQGTPIIVIAKLLEAQITPIGPLNR
ncbi:MAG: hypothetical protein F7B60_03170 [Desulfurococcales archaeon]|nr:hypothetical protein [Desulfurococcales archaeon]